MEALHTIALPPNGRPTLWTDSSIALVAIISVLLPSDNSLDKSFLYNHNYCRNRKSLSGHNSSMNLNLIPNDTKCLQLYEVIFRLFAIVLCVS